MLTKDLLLQKFNESISGKNHQRGKIVFENDLVSSISITSEDDLLCIDGNVISENLFNEYHTIIELKSTNLCVMSTYCSCEDFEKNSHKKENYCCKHIIATFYRAIEDLLSNSRLCENFNESSTMCTNKKDLLSMLIGNNSDKEMLKLEVYINKSSWDESISCEFRIGLNSMSSSKLYVLKDINQFFTAYYNNIPVKYGQNFTFYIKEQYFSEEDKSLISFIEMLRNIESSSKNFYLNGKIIDGKFLKIPKYLIREFFNTIRNHRVYLNEGFFSRVVESEILCENPLVDFDLKLIKKDYVLKSPNGMPKSLDEKGRVLLYGTTIYLPDYKFSYALEPYLEVFSNAKVITFPSNREDAILNHLIPKLNSLSERVSISKNIQDKIVREPVFFNFYLNRDNEEIILTVKVKYGTYEFNIFHDFKEKVIYRNNLEESNLIKKLNSLGFTEYKDKFYLLNEEDTIFNFLKNELHKLQNLGDVYYSENFKGIKNIKANSLHGEVEPGKYDYFEMKFKIDEISEDERKSILHGFRNKLKFYKLKHGEYLDLESLELKEFLKLMDALAPLDEEEPIILPKSKSIFLEKYLEEENIDYIEGTSLLKPLTDKFSNIESLSFEVPKELKANLRNYQRIGYNWLKTLDYLGFGGILADEMGLGKTLQAISFILSNKNKKTLIVAPTSLIYNWESEFQKFAPSLKVAINNGSPSEREEFFKHITEFDVVITTYNLLKLDLSCYNDIFFDYFILDEAQYIKNPHGKTSKAVKKIKSKTRFALTGTPIENSLMELWSIFDFIMPGYLYDEKVFSVRYHKKLKESKVVLTELKRLVSPFILRRKKKDVLSELPPKIEKTIRVNLNEAQKEIYSTYTKYVVDLIEKKIEDDEFHKDKIEILSYITKLRQICLEPSLVVDNYEGGSGKVDALMEVLHQSIASGHKILLFSQFTSLLKILKDRFIMEDISFSYLDGSVPSQTRNAMVKEFNEGDKSVFLISLKAGGTGLNLTSADVVIHFDPWWNPAVEDQATDRAHRIGQENVVEVVKILAKDTLEEKVVYLQKEKQNLISKVLDDNLQDSSNLTSLSEEDVLKLFDIV